MKKTVMVIDDQQAVRKLLTQSLGQYYDVIEMPGAAEAMNTLSEGRHVDAIISDLVMPEMSGIEFLEESQKKFGKNMPPVMMLSSNDNYAEKSRSFELGAQDYVVKPFNPKELRMRLNHVIEKADEIAMYIQKLEESNNELMHFANTVSHEMREPLRMVTSYLCLLDRTMSDMGGTMQKDCIEFALGGARRMESMIHDLLRLARIDQDPKMEDISLNEIADHVKNNLEILIKERMASVIVRQLPVIKADKTQMTQLLQNLIGNGIKYNESLKPTIEVYCERHGEAIKLCVSDNGIGIPTEYREKAFNLFQRLPNGKKYSGAGIGLTICKKIVDGMNGEISIENNEGGGTIFSIILPASI